MSTKIPHYCVVGGGMSGLATAYFITMAKPVGSYRLTLLEAGSRFGGWVHSERSSVTGSLLELGPHSARATGSSTLLLRMALHLGLRDSLEWMCGGQESTRRLIYAKGRHFALSPSAFLSYNSPLRLPMGSIVRNLLSRRPSGAGGGDISVDEFFRTRLGNRYADYVGSAFIRGIYAGDARQLSAEACLSQLINIEKTSPNLMTGLLMNLFSSFSSNGKSTSSIPRVFDEHLPPTDVHVPPAKAIAWSLSEGMQQLPDSLVAKLRSTDSHTIQLVSNAQVKSVSLTPSRTAFRVCWMHHSDGQTPLNDTFDAVFLCCPSFKSADMLKSVASESTLQRLGKRSLPWASVAVISLEVDRDNQPPIPGFGYLVPQIEDANILGVIYDSFAFPKLDGARKDTLRYTIMVKPYDNWLSGDSGHVSAELKQAGIDVLRKQMKIERPRVVNAKTLVCHDCIPQYPVGHLTNISSLRSELASQLGGCSNGGGLHLVGFSYDGVGLSDVVSSSLKAVTLALKLC